MTGGDDSDTNGGGDDIGGDVCGGHDVSGDVCAGGNLRNTIVTAN